MLRLCDPLVPTLARYGNQALGPAVLTMFQSYLSKSYAKGVAANISLKSLTKIQAENNLRLEGCRPQMAELRPTTSQHLVFKEK
jgi:hypothetical protein